MKEENYDKNSSGKNVVCYTNVSWSSAVLEIRLKLPLQACGHNLIRGNHLDKMLVEDLSGIDYVVIQRDFPQYVDQFFHVLNQTRKHNIPLIYEIDDLLFELPDDHPDRQINHYTGSLMSILTAIEKADLVTTSTAPLANYLLAFNPNIRILTNYLADAYWPLITPNKARNTHNKVTIGYVGTGTHLPDLNMILPALTATAEKYGSRIAFKFFGINPPAELSSRYQVAWIPEVYNYQEYAHKLSKENIDIFVAPLQPSEFADCKSSLKFLEYGSTGVPAVYSRVLPYEEVVVHGKNGFLASSNEEWIQLIGALIESPKLRYDIAFAAQDNIKKNWLLSQHAHEWAAVYKEAIHSKNPVTENVKRQEAVLQKTLKLQSSYVSDLKGQASDMTARISDLTATVSDLTATVSDLTATVSDLTATVSDLTATVSDLTAKIGEREKAYQEAVTELISLKTSRSWKLFIILISLFRKIVPPGTSRDRVFTHVWKYTHLAYRTLRTGLIKLSNLSLQNGSSKGSRISIPPISIRRGLEPHSGKVDIIVCVHNALDDVRKCLESVATYTSQPYSIILVDDGSDTPTQSYLHEFVENHGNCTLLRNEQAGGYTRAANKGLKQSKSDYVVLLNSDTLVGPEWIDRMCMAMGSDERNGIVGPLSNTASWQSIPKLSKDGDWAQNELPEGVTAEAMSCLIGEYSARTYFQVPLLNGFCMMIRWQVINDIGYLDEESFGEGYGEEDDFNLRAQNKGWKLVIADDVYVFHAQSKSYSNERRHRLSQRAGAILREKHGEGTIQRHVAYMHPNRIMEGIRAASDVMVDREEYKSRGRQAFLGKKVLFVLPVMEAGGGANVVIDEARAMQTMGVDVQIFNKIEYRKSFLSSYPHLDIPANFGNISDLMELSRSYDATIATANYSVDWLKPLENKTILGYYVQGFEPLMYPHGSPDWNRALASYSLIEGMKRFTKTEWVRRMVLDNTKMDSNVIGISVNVDLFRPRDVRAFGEKPITITAMIRPESPYRSPELTIAVFRRIQKEFGKMVNILLFGTDSLEEYRTLFQLDFEWKLAGKLTQLQVANLLSNSDIFVDFSTHQAMGLTALEAMACGCSVIVPQEGGAIEFVRDRDNGLVLPVISQDACYQQLRTLVEDDYLRQRLQIAGLKTVSRFFPERASFNILKTLFS